MLDTIFIGMSGLTGYSKGLRVIGNNLTNVNTPGFKGSQLQFADLFYQGSANTAGSGQAGGRAQLGMGLNTLATTINFKAGDLRQTGGGLDLAINGEGFFVLNDDGKSRYTRAGQFQFDNDGFLVSTVNGLRVSGLDENGKLTDISLTGLQSNPPKATTTVKFNGNISSNAASDAVLNGIKVIDPAGGEHLIKMTFKNNSATTMGNWTVTISDDTGTLGTGTIQFSNGKPDGNASKIAFNYAPTGIKPFSVMLDFSSDVTSFAAGNTSTIAVKSQDGVPAGAMTDVAFDAQGALVVTYSNGQTANGTRLALARFNSTEDIVALGGNEFGSTNDAAVHLGYAKTNSFGSLSSGVVEGANVDLAEEFSNLIVMQRGYQAASHVISTANELIEQLYEMKGR
ncbi:MAG TPA: flagellar hook-basal body complex protein [Noviherbaspirillum sp.]|nr:flagellar hook-basal body complex protein [Noviherbaspirillum sp.]